jgi:tetratricopeptide (TPR) repeat protein
MKIKFYQLVRIHLIILFVLSLIFSLKLSSSDLLSHAAQETFLIQAQRHYALGQYQKAIELLESYLKTEDTPSPQTYQLLGEAYQKIGQPSLAIHTFY